MRQRLSGLELVPMYNRRYNRRILVRQNGGNILKKIAHTFTGIGNKIADLFGGARYKRYSHRRVNKQRRRYLSSKKRRAKKQKGGFLGTLAASIVAPMIFEEILK